MSRDIDLPLALRHDQALSNIACTSAPGNVYSNVHVGAGGRSHLGNNYNYGPTEDQQILHSILQSLHYPEMGQRGSDVPDAGTDTFEWLFGDYGRQPSHDSDESDEYEREFMDDEEESNERNAYDQEEREDTSGEDLSDIESTYSEDQCERDDIAVKLRSWLKDDGDNVFWITGKPGSGKSTFMKFLRDHDGTHALLQEWAREDLLVTADHFFWLPGTPLQNSFEGLARNLMHAILSSLLADINLAKSICTKRRWSLTTSHRPWSQSEFKRMFVNLGGLRGIRVFLLIDGLDECCPQQKHDDLMAALLDIVRPSSIKACLSSRPWREFAARLDRSPSLCLEKITRLDMVTYVSNRIHQATQERTMLAKVVRKLVCLVVGRADGVFLWVELVVRAVIVELRKGRGMSRVLSIVEGLPSELDDYFTRLIYERIEKTTGNTSDTASLLNLAIKLDEWKDRRFYNGRHPYLDYWLLSRGAFDRAMKCPHANVPKYSPDEAAVMRTQTQSFLEIASKDLLVLRDSNVEFTHRTVRDFLMNGSVNEAIRQQSPPHFQEPDFVLRVQTLRCIHLLMMPDIRCGQVDNILWFASYLSCVDKTIRRNLNIILTACEARAIEHLHDARSCYGLVSTKEDSSDGVKHQMRFYLRDLWDPSWDSTPYRYIRTLLRRWPHFAHKSLLGKRHRMPGSTGEFVRTLRHLSLRDLCSTCTTIMHDCLYYGCIPDGWIVQKQLVHPVDIWSNEVAERVVHVKSDDGPLHSICEYCGISLPYSRDCGLRETFFLLEKLAFRSTIPQAELLVHDPISTPRLEGRIVNMLPFELPWSLLHRSGNTQAVSDTSHIRQFIWNRQKLRAARSLLTSVRGHLSSLAAVEPKYRSALLAESQANWLSFLRTFVEPLASQDTDDHSGLQCSCCGCCCCGCNCVVCDLYFDEGKRCCESIVVSLQPNGFPMHCKGCYRQSAFLHGLSPSFVLTIQFEPPVALPDKDPPPNPPPNRGIVKAVSETIAWYSHTASAFGLGYLIPSDVKAIQQALLAVPETQQ